MDKDDEIYSFKLYKFSEVHAANSMDDYYLSLRPKIHCTDQYLYLHGTSTFFPVSRTSLRPSVWRYNFCRNEWSMVHRASADARRPKPAFSCSTLWQDILFFRTCAFSDPSSHTHQSVYFINLKTCTSSMKFVDVIKAPITEFRKVETSPTDMCNPPQYGGYGMAVHGEYLYLVGGKGFHGTDVFLTMDIYMLHMKTGKWTKLYDSAMDRESLSRHRVRHAIMYYEHKLYIFGGFSRTRTLSLEMLPVFDLNSKSWKVHKTVGDSEGLLRFPSNRGDFAIAQDPYQPSVVFVNGGCEKNIEHLVSFNDTWRIDLKTLQWKFIASLTMSEGRCVHSMSTTPEGQMYVFGGLTQAGRRGKFVKAWVNVPRLADICCDALMFYTRKSVIRLSDDPRTAQLPQKYRDRFMNE